MAYRFNERVLRYYLQRLTRKQKLYRVLKEELTSLGYWRNRNRGRHARKRRG